MPNTEDFKADLPQMIIDGIQDRKGHKITVVDMTAIEAAPVSRFIIAEGTSNMHVGAIADSVRDTLLERAGVKPYNYDGYSSSEWIVLDYGDTLVHIFHPDARHRYQLEDLWYDATIVNIPDLD